MVSGVYDIQYRDGAIFFAFKWRNGVVFVFEVPGRGGRSAFFRGLDGWLFFLPIS